MLQDQALAELFEDPYSEADLALVARDLLDPNHFPLAAQFDFPHGRVQIHGEFNMRTNFLMATLDDKHAAGTDIACDARLLID